MARVLIVEDERPLRRIIALNLVRRGYSVAEADSVAAADEALRVWGDSFDMLLLDVNLPDQTGWDVLRHLSQRAPTAALAEQHTETMPKVIIIAAMRPSQQRIEEFHPDAVLVKPFPLQALFRLIERVLSSAPATAEMEEAGETGETEEAEYQR